MTATVAIAFAAMAPMSDAQATVSSAATPLWCNGQTAEHIVKTYSARVPYRSAPLRCGNGRYGYTHVIARWVGDPGYDSNIATALLDFTSTEDSGSSVTFVRLFPQCPADTFRVVIEYGNFADGEPQGFITAYITVAVSL